MHDRPRRQVCRVAFLALCMLPAAGVLAWSGWRAGTWHRQACAAELSRAVGLQVSCTALSYPRPGIMLYQGVELSDPETAAPLARMRFLETGGSGGTSAWVASQPEFDAVQLRDFWQLVDRRLREASDTATTTRLSAAEATLHWPAGSQTLTDVHGQISMPGAAGGPRTATLSFRIAGIEMPEPIRLRVTRERDGDAAGEANPNGSQLKTTLELHTSGAALPCATLAVPLGVANRLGGSAKFRGSVWATATTEGWEGELSGQFTDVDLQNLVSEQFPHRLSGTAEITVQKARFSHGRLEEAVGTLSAGPGVVSQSLVSAAVEYLHLVPGPANSHADMLRQYEQLALAFVVDSAGLTLHGQCAGAPGVVMRLGDGTVLGEAGGPSGPLVALVRTLVPRSEVQVPATRQSDWLIERLPVPQAILPDGQSPHGRLRLDRANKWGSNPAD
jgi:hypothetical protein